MRRVFVCFLEESLGLKICFRNYLTFSRIVNFDNCKWRFRLNLKTATLTSKCESLLTGGSWPKQEHHWWSRLSLVQTIKLAMFFFQKTSNIRREGALYILHTIKQKRLKTMTLTMCTMTLTTKSMTKLDISV